MCQKQQTVKRANNMRRRKIKWGRIVASIFIVLVILSTIARIGNKIVVSQWENSIEGQIARSNRLCPIDISGIGKIKSIALEGNEIVYNIEYDESVVDLTWMKNNPDEAKKIFVLSQYVLNGQNNNGDKFMEIVRSKGLGIAMNINGFRISISSKELASYEQLAKSSPSEAIRDIISINIRNVSDSLPTEIDEGLLCTDIITEEKNIVYKITVDETKYDILKLEEIKDTIRDELFKDWFSSPITRNLLTLCKIANIGIVWEMLGDASGQRCEIVIDHEYISSHVQTLEQLNIK